jgi:hypothetical protein
LVGAVYGASDRIGGVITSVLFSLGFESTLVAEFVLFGVERLRGHEEPSLAELGTPAHGS